MTTKFLDRIKEKPLLFDGAMGTMLYSKGFTSEQSFETLNLARPAVVAEVHRAYIDAGADIIETNTFGANRIKLAKYGLADQMVEINRSAVELARRVVQASFKEVLIAGSIGPLGRYMAPLGRLQSEEAFENFKEQVTALLTEKVDLLLFETFSDLRELEQAVKAARTIDAEIPIIAQVTFANDGLTPLGDSPARVAKVLSELPVQVIGVNCSVGPARVLRSIQALAEHLPPGTLLSAQPNAGWPHQLGNRLMYPANPDYFGEYATRFLEAGVAVIGGCCGTTADHIARMRQVLDRPIEPRPASARPIITSVDELDRPSDPREPTSMARKLARGEFVASVEINPPRGASVSRILAATQMLQEAGASVVNVADTPIARMRMSPWAVCHLIQSEVGLETVLNFPIRGRNLLRVQGDLLAAHALNIRNLFVVMGDPTTIGDYPEAFNNHDVVPTGLIHLVKHGFNTGVDYAGKEITEPTHFLVGCALNLRPAKLETEINLLKKKIDSGADFAMTQPIYESHVLGEFVQQYEARHGELAIPIIMSVMPLHNDRNAEFLHNEVPGMVIPESLRDRMRRAGKQGPQEGVKIALELIFQLRDKIQGIYIMPQFERYHVAAEIIETLQRENRELAVSEVIQP